jgi:uncharacterized protein (DUF1778 family)
MQKSVIQKPRSKLVNFRLTEDEYANLKRASVVSGARSFSDFARSAALNSAEEPASDSLRTQALSQKINELQSTIRSLTRVLERLAPSDDPTNGAIEEPSDNGIQSHAPECAPGITGKIEN